MQSKSRQTDITNERASKLLGLTHLALGKSQARQNFFPLFKQLTLKSLTVGITDRDNKEAVVMISKVHFDALVNKLWELSKPSNEQGAEDLMGCITIIGDLEEGSKNASKRLRQSIARSAESL